MERRAVSAAPQSALQWQRLRSSRLDAAGVTISGTYDPADTGATAGIPFDTCGKDSDGLLQRPCKVAWCRAIGWQRRLLAHERTFLFVHPVAVAKTTYLSSGVFGR